MAQGDIPQWETYVLTAGFALAFWASMRFVHGHTEALVRRLIPKRFGAAQWLLRIVLMLAVSFAAVIVLFTVLLVVLYAIRG